MDVLCCAVHPVFVLTCGVMGVDVPPTTNEAFNIVHCVLCIICLSVCLSAVYFNTSEDYESLFSFNTFFSV